MLFSKSILFVSIVLASACSNYKLLVVDEEPDIDQLNFGKKEVGQMINQPKKIYPRRMLRVGQSGWVLLNCSIDIDGKTTVEDVVDFSPSEYFVKYAVQYAESALFQVMTEPVTEYYLLVRFTKFED